MAELTQLESKLGEVMGLAQAAQVATSKAMKLVDDEGVGALLQRMHDEAQQAEQRCADLVAGREGRKGALQAQARETKSEAQEMMRTYLEGDADGLDALEFLVMAEAGELGHVEIVKKLNERAGDSQVGKLIDWLLPIQERHMRDTREAALTLAAQEDPNEPA